MLSCDALSPFDRLAFFLSFLFSLLDLISWFCSSSHPMSNLPKIFDCRSAYDLVSGPAETSVRAELATSLMDASKKSKN
jgi:hypothetical protein